MKLREHLSIYLRAIKMTFSASPRFIICILCDEIISAVMPYVPVWFSARLVDGLISYESTDKLMLLAVLGVFLTFALATLRTFISSVESRAEYDVYTLERWSYSQKALEMAYERMEDRETKLLLERVKKETQTGWNRFYLYRSYREITFSVSGIVAGIGMSASLFTLSSLSILEKLGLILLFLLTVAVNMFTENKAQASKNRFWESAIDMNVIDEKCASYIKDYISGMDIRLYGMEDNLDEIMTRCDEKFGIEGSKQRMKENMIKLPSDFLLHALKLALYALLISAALAGEVSVGSIAKYVSCVILVLGAFNDLARILTITATNNHYLKRYFSYFDIPNNMYQGSLTVEKREDAEYDIEFENVSFKYPGSETFALKNINLKFRVGQKLAVVGENGSGKTTFIKLLCRLYDPTEGRILLNGVDIKKYDYDEYMSVFSVVFQDFKLFSFTLGQNVATATDYDREKVLDALEKAEFTERLSETSNGLNTYLYKDVSDTGLEISGGEAQKIALARALYKNAPFLILDEPTAALDPISEAEVYSRFNEIADIKTAIYISHRLSSCRFCDEILVFDSGSIVQRGNHESLVKSENGKYAELWFAQAQYYQ
ncbi:MAG: ABC transporter ATP-binding protein [Clostridia bacterium]|nr:ABC transporter ATP-binding protein [Clostridia bacterium]